LQPSDLSDCNERFPTHCGADQRGIGQELLIEIKMERSEIAAGGTIKKGLHKTPTTECVPQLFVARRLASGSRTIDFTRDSGEGCVERLKKGWGA
jgi:hypothetical protein